MSIKQTFTGVVLGGDDAEEFRRAAEVVEAEYRPTYLLEAERVILPRALKMYPTHNERAAMRGALGDAAALCDALATQIGHDNRARGRITKQGLALAAAVTRAGNAIWAMREKIDVPKE